MIWVDPCQTASGRDCQTASGRDCQTASGLNCQTASGLNCQTASGRDWRSAVQRQLAVVDMQTHPTAATKDSPCVIWLGSGLAEVVHLDAV